MLKSYNVNVRCTDLFVFCQSQLDSRLRGNDGRGAGRGAAVPLLDRHPGSGVAVSLLDRHPGSGAAAIRDPHALRWNSAACGLWIPDQVGNDGRGAGSGVAVSLLDRHPGSGVAVSLLDRHPGSGAAAIRDPHALRWNSAAYGLWIPDQVGNDGRGAGSGAAVPLLDRHPGSGAAVSLLDRHPGSGVAAIRDPS
jgi:hypothetical protein